MATFLSYSKRVTETNYSHKFEYSDEPGSGYSVTCDKSGAMLPGPDASRLQDQLAGIKLLCDTTTLQYLGVVGTPVSYIEPATVECSRCGQPHTLGNSRNPDSQCACGQHYNLCGQELRDDWEDKSTYAMHGETWDEY